MAAGRTQVRKAYAVLGEDLPGLGPQRVQQRAEDAVGHDLVLMQLQQLKQHAARQLHPPFLCGAIMRGKS